jgi:hypothetical protein
MEVPMNKSNVLEMRDFEYTPEWFGKLKSVLKEGQVVRNPFVKFYSDGASVTIIKDMEEQRVVYPKENKR